MKQAWTGHYDAHGSASDVDCVIGFSFGYRMDGRKVTPGLSNQDLANIALNRFSRLPLILQFEIADAYDNSDGKGKVHRIDQHRKKGKYLDTREVADQARGQMESQGYKNAAIVAHPHHIPRADAVCRKLGIATTVTDDMRGAVEFDPLSEQKWTRDIDAWRGYEPEAIEYYQLRGWL